MILVGFVGFINSGKGTAADILCSRGFNKLSFADPVKDATAIIFGWDRHLLEGDTKESRVWRENPDPFWTEVMGRNFTPREALQKIGTEAGRHVFHEDLWLLSLKKRLKGNTVVPDTRFQNEIDFIHKQGGIIVQISKGKQPDWYEAASEANNGDIKSIVKMQKYGIHESEWKWIDYNTDYCIYNDGTLQDLEDNLFEVLTKAYGKSIIEELKHYGEINETI